MNKIQIRTHAFALLTVSLLGLSTLAGCASDSELEAGEEGTPADALVGGNDKLSSTSTAYPDRIEAPEKGNEDVVKSFKAGKRVIAGASTKKNPRGYLRTITSYTVKSGKLILQTVPATLEDAIKDGRTRAPTATEQLESNALQLDLQATVKAGGETKLASWNVFSDAVGTIKANGSSFSMTPDASLDMEFAKSTLTKFNLKISGKMLAKLALQVSGSGVNFEAMESKPLGVPIKIAVVPVWGVPVSIYVQAEVFAGCKLSASSPYSGQFALSASASAQVNVSYASGKWSKAYTSTGSVDATGSLTAANGVAKFVGSYGSSCSGGLAFKILVADLAGPELKLYESVDATVAKVNGVTTGTLTRKLAADFGLTIGVMGRNLETTFNVGEVPLGKPVAWKF